MSSLGASPLRFASELVVEKGLIVPETSCGASPNVVVVVVVVVFLRTSLHTAGRDADAEEIGILNAFARDARTGESGRIVRCVRSSLSLKKNVVLYVVGLVVRLFKKLIRVDYSSRMPLRRAAARTIITISAPRLKFFDGRAFSKVDWTGWAGNSAAGA